MKTNYIYILLSLLLLFSCDDMEDVDTDTGGNGNAEIGTSELYVLSEGLFNLNNSTLMRYTYHDNRIITDYFRNVNRRGLGDTANDMAMYGSRLYIVVNVSAQVEVIDWQTGLSIAQIPITDENGISRQPRYITFHEDKAYVCSFDGTIARIDTTSLTVDGYTKAGRNPDGICVQNNKLYVSNSGGLDAPEYDNTVSVIDLATFTETKRITVGKNPGKIAGDKYGNVYVAIRGNLADSEYGFVRINSYTDKVEENIQEQVLNFAINHDMDLAYLYTFSYVLKTSGVKVFNIKDQRIENDHFISDGTQINTPFTIRINPYSGNIYIADAYDYKVTGDIYCFSSQGQLIFKLNNIGINPNTILFYDKLSNSILDDNTDDNHSSAFASKVLEYLPAPNQFMNTSTTAYQDGFTTEEVLEYATKQIKAKSMLTLGSYGGYITLGFDHTIPNKKGEYDFRIYGNAYLNQGNTGGSCEPGIVLVSKDTNNNGLPDDEWYELAGSEYYSGNVLKDYHITYYKPVPALSDVYWKDNRGNEGYIPRNPFHTTNSYFPAWIEEDELTFWGSRLPDNGIEEGNTWVLYPYPWGYADNHPNNSEYSKFNIDWAVDKNGNPVALDGIDFIKVYTAVNQVCGWLGETSTEISTIEDLHFDK